MEQTLRVAKRAQLTRIGNRAVSTLGYRNDLVEEHLKWHLGLTVSKKWCTVSCLATTFFGRNSEANRKEIRGRMARTFKVLLSRGLFLVVEYDATRDGHGKIVACKLFERHDGLEAEYAHSQIERMRHRRQITEETWQRAMEVLCQSAPIEPQPALALDH